MFLGYGTSLYESRNVVVTEAYMESVVRSTRGSLLARNDSGERDGIVGCWHINLCAVYSYSAWMGGKS